MARLPLLLSLVFFTRRCSHALMEDERVEAYHDRNYTWPPRMLVPDTEGWKQLFHRRFAQVQRIDRESVGRYEGWFQSVNAAYVAPNFTETGWGLTRAPDDLVEALRKGIRDGLPNARREDFEVDVIEGEVPLFVDRPDLTRRVLHELKPMHEAWSGVELEPYLAYGFRLYRNQSNLLMHVDKAESHIISSILHIDSSEDSEPWPIVIEDYEGNTNEVILKSGDLLFYESSKCFHGRPKKFNGSWYSSIFVHYHPKDWTAVDHMLEAHYGVPPDWNAEVPQPTPDDPEELVMVGTCMKEPQCDDGWCGLADAVKMSGPGQKDYVITTGGKRYPLWPAQGELSSKTEGAPSTTHHEL